MRNDTPKWALNFLRWFCREEYLDEIEGDLVEMYVRRSKRSVWLAKLSFVWDIFRSFRWINLKSTRSIATTGMFRNHLTTGYRSLVGDMRFTLINLLGLSAGLAVFITIALFVYHELNFDSFHTRADRIYQVIQDFENHDGSDPEIYTSFYLAGAVRKEFSFVENSVTIHGAASTWFEVEEKRFFEEEGIVSGPEFFEIFDFKLLKGERSRVLSNKRSIVLSESLGKKLFENEDPVGQEINLNHYGRFTVSGIMEDVPANSYIRFNYLISQDYEEYFKWTASWYPGWFKSWNGNGVTTYVLLNSLESKSQFEAEIPDLLRKHLDAKEPNKHFLLALEELHFGSNGIDGRVNEYVKGDIGKVRFLIIIASIILMMACFNYINITTARSLRRAKEVGIRKTLGAFQHQVKTQFLMEAFLLVLVSFIAGMILVLFLLPYFNRITGIELSLTYELLLDTSPYLLGTILLVTCLAGFYPAFYLSKFSPMFILNRAKGSSRSNTLLRSGLITAQYMISILILSSLIIVSRQYAYLANSPLGFDAEELVVVEINSGEVRNSFELIRQELLAVPGIVKVAGLSRMISGYRSPTSILVSDPDSPQQARPMRYYGIDEHAIGTLQLELKRGQNFTGNKATDSLSIFMNEQAAALYGGESAIGKWVEIDSDQNENFRAKLIGILKDFHFNSLHSSIGPVVLGYYKNPFISLDDIVIKVDAHDLKETLVRIEEIHNKYDDNGIMTWEFADDMAQRAYEEEEIFKEVFSGAAIIAFLMALLGIIGLTSYNVTAKSKEMGIRKILGASILSILSIHMLQFVKFLVIALFISVPITWWFSHKWLTNYAYRIDISPFLFLPVFGLVLAVTILVIVAVAGKIASADPVNSIRYE